MPEARGFSPEVKKIAVARLELGESGAAIAAELGVNRITVHKWRRALREGRSDAAPGPGITAQAAIDKALGALAEVLDQSESEASRIAAANAILARAHAKGAATEKAEPEKKPLPTRIEWVIVDPRDEPEA